MLDTGTVRLVILLGMFLYFAGDYNSLVASIWGSSGDEGNQTEAALKRQPEGPPKHEGLERMIMDATKKSLDEENGRQTRSRLKIPCDLAR